LALPQGAMKLKFNIPIGAQIISRLNTNALERQEERGREKESIK